jgi:hypothetical protein
MKSASVRHAIVESIEENSKIHGLHVEMVPHLPKKCGYISRRYVVPSTRELVQGTDSLLAPVLASIVAAWSGNQAENGLLSSGVSVLAQYRGCKETVVPVSGRQK